MYANSTLKKQRNTYWINKTKSIKSQITFTKQTHALVNMLMNLRGSIKGGEFD